MTTWQKVRAYLIAFLRILFRRILLFVVIICGLVCASFPVTGGFTIPVLSERLVWSGLIITLISGFLVFGSTVGGRDYELPGAFVRSAHVNDLIEFNITVRQQVESRFDGRIQGFVVGLCVFGVGALVQSIFG
ncbi:hypothetical protein ATHL_01748 [Anaerolinea thermolimosa]|uniref:hypothetical protein n=1 Tax=Anaerolinea thermolimosa TaxID=229919 RepID=UPI0007812CE9|nr:hypothetical protein [Anaerolinea thermolimosa]GAP06884.1 hypothetical protein ATHL_01748 [Anaerolinea thermolimosa]